MLSFIEFLEKTIQNIMVQGYRSIQKLTLPMENLNIVTGANGCGKSNLYKSIYLLAKASYGELAKTLSLEGGTSSILWLVRRKKHLSLKVLYV